jgi:hypothetical protein
MLARFIRDQARAGAVRFDLRQVISDETGSTGQVDSFALETEQKPHDLAGEIENVANGDSAALGGVNAYALISFGVDGKERARRGFRIAAETPVGQLTPSEKPTMMGMRAQEMRHNEVSAALGSRVALEMIENYRVLVDDFRNELKETRKELVAEQAKRVEFINLFEQLSSARAERELEAAKEQRKADAQREMIAKLSTLWPLILHKLSGSPASALSGGHEEMLSILLANITRAELSAMAGALPLEKKMIFWEVIKQLIPEPPATSTAPPPPPPPAPPPAAEAA